MTRSARLRPATGLPSAMVLAWTMVAATMVAATMLTACAGDEPAVVIDTDWTLAEPTFEVGGLGDDERYILGEVGGGIRLEDGRIVIADRLAYGLKMYAADGRFLAQVGSEGEGPGEFEHLRGMGRCAEGRIVAYQINWGQNVYDLDLDFVGTRPAEIDALGGGAYELACNEAGYILATGWARDFNVGFHVANAPVVLLRDGELVHDFGERLSSERVGFLRDDGSPAGSGPHPFGRSMSVALGPDRAYLGDASDYRVEVYDLDGTRLPDIIWEGPDLALTEEDFAALLERMVEDEAPSNRPAVRRRWRDLPRLERHPAYDMMMADTGGNLWVRHFPQADATSADWVIFDPDGARIGGLSLPLRATLLDANPDWVLLSELDDLDVATVRLYGIRR